MKTLERAVKTYSLLILNDMKKLNIIKGFFASQLVVTSVAIAQ